MVKRAAPEHKANRREHTKRVKYDNSSISVSGKFVNTNDIRMALTSPDTSIVTHALAILRNQLTVRSNEPVLTPQDQRLLTVKSWFEESPEAGDVFSIMDRTPQPSPGVTSLCLAVLSSLINLLSTHFIYHNLGEPIIKSLLSPSNMHQLNLNLASTNSELILSTLKIFNAMSTYAGNSNQRAIMDAFSWGQKSLHKLLFLRRKNKGVQELDPISTPDIRTSYILFILSFLSKSTPTPIKLSLLEQHKDVFLLVFKGIAQDPYPVVRRILEVCWEGVCNDSKIKRTLKVGLFSEQTISHLLKLYARDSAEDSTPDHIPADLVHHFMLALMTRPGIGICFKDRGWYPREYFLEESAMKPDDVDRDDSSTSQGGKINNKILANIVKGLKVNEDERQQELALRILEACPELVAGYWSTANLTLEPRLSSRWISNIATFGKIILLPVPTDSFLLPHSAQHDPSPPPLFSILANVLPSVLTKTHFTKGLQSPSRLVQHCTALTLAKCVSKLHRVSVALRETARKLGEDEETGQWSKRLHELEVEAEKRVPDSMVIIAMVQQKYQDTPDEQGNAQATMLTECALRLLRLYHEMFPRLIAEVRFDVGKLLLNVMDPTLSASLEGDDMAADRPLIQEAPRGMDILRQLHVLRLLRDNDQFIWSNKSGPLSRSHLHVILSLYTKTPHSAVRTATSDLVSDLLSPSILFSHDPAELILWLSALPLTRRGSQAVAPDGTALLDESTGVLTFLDDCIQRCNKTPYRYLEESISSFSDTASEEVNPDDALLADDQKKAPSPLLMTLLEQLRAKLIGNLISPSDALAVVTFIRKLICNLACKLPALRCARKLQARLWEICLLRGFTPNAPTIQDAVERECELLSGILGFLEEPNTQEPVTSGAAVQQFLEQVEKLPNPPSANVATNLAYELVDWVRLVRPPLHPQDVKRLMLAILRFSHTAAREFVYQLDPRHGYLWYAVEDNFGELETQLPFEWAYLHATPAQIAQPIIKDCLTSLFFSEVAWNKSFGRRLSIIMERLAFRMKRKAKVAALRYPELSLIASILERSRSGSSGSDVEELKRVIFMESRAMKALFCSSDISTVDLEDLGFLVKTCLKPQSASDRVLALDYCDYWVAHSKSVRNLRSCVLASPWISFMDSASVIQYLDIILSSVKARQQLSGTDRNVVMCILDTLLILLQTTPAFLETLQDRLRDLLCLRSHCPQSSTIDTILLFIVESGIPLGYDSHPLAIAPHLTVSDVSVTALERWKNRAAQLPSSFVLAAELLQSEDWTGCTARIISGAIYKSLAARRKFSIWLTQTQPHRGSSLETVALALHAFLDVSLQNQDSRTQLHLPDPWFSALVRYLLLMQGSVEGLGACSSCIRAAVEASPSRRAHYASHILNEANLSASGSITNAPFLFLIRDLHQIDATYFSDLLCKCSDEALIWMACRFSETPLSDEDLSLVDHMTSVISRKEAKAYLVEPVLKAAIQSCLHVPRLIQNVIPLLSSTSFKPATVNRLLQSIVQHSQLFRLAGASLKTREPIIRLLHALFYLHPTNTCQPSHVDPLTRLYGGTLSSPDRLLFSIFHLYERQRKESVASVFRRWSPSGSPSQDAFGAITKIDPSKAFRTCTAFPTRRRLDATLVAENGTIEDDGVYDPVFLTLLLVQFLEESKDLSTTEWVQVFRSNIISVVMCVLTSRDEALRKVGISTLAGVLRRIQDADFLEREQMVYIMNILRDLLPSPASLPSVTSSRLPTYAVMVLAHALRSIFYPASFLYPVVLRFLLQRPELDTTDVPMLYSLLYSSEDGGDWTRERAWMVRFLTDSIREGSARDWTVLKRRHTWDLLASMWQAARKDERALRRGVLEFLANLSANQHSITSLILRSSLLSWIELQLQTRSANEVEYTIFVKILENILITADVDRVNKATHGEFSATAIRCLNAVLSDIKQDKPSDGSNLLVLLCLISRITLRMASQPCPNAALIGDVERRIISILKSIESSIPWKTAARQYITPRPSLLPQPPHHARGLFDLPKTGEDTEVWSECVRLLWKTSMILVEWPGDKECWDELSCRLLVVRTFDIYCAGGNGEKDVGEWARRQTIGCLLESEGERVEHDQVH